MTTKTTLQTDWLDYWFKVPVVIVSNNQLVTKLAELKAQGIFVHNLIVKQDGYELHGRIDK